MAHCSNERAFAATVQLETLELTPSFNAKPEVNGNKAALPLHIQTTRLQNYMIHKRLIKSVLMHMKFGGYCA